MEFSTSFIGFYTESFSSAIPNRSMTTFSGTDTVLVSWDRSLEEVVVELHGAWEQSDELLLGMWPQAGIGF